MKHIFLKSSLLVILFCVKTFVYAQTDLKSIPLDKGLPIIVQTGLSYRSIDAVDENMNTFTATVDLRMIWYDLRQKFKPEDVTIDFLQFSDDDDLRPIPDIWMPTIKFSNMDAEPISLTKLIRIFPDGKIELLQRIKAVFAQEYDVFRFPFDSQKLNVIVSSKKEDKLKVNFEFRQNDLEFSNIPNDLEISGWYPKTIELSKSQTQGWYGKNFPVFNACLIIERNPTSSIFGIFLPLIASLLIPLLIVWLNKLEDGEFRVDGFELTNIVIGGLFAVVALNFTINSSFTPLASGDNTVMRLFALNYITLAISFAICILLYRFNIVTKTKGRYYQEELFLFINWALPLTVFLMSIFILLFALL